jgi:hypothetical protein
VSDLVVECREDPRGPVPVRFGRGGVRLDVVALEDRWPGEDHEYFRVRTADGGVFILRFDRRRRAWAIAVFRAGEDEPGAERAGGT